MSVLGILSSSLLGYSTQGVQNRRQQFRQEFQQLGQDLQSGKLTAAQADFATLQQSAPQGSSTSSGQSSSPIAQAFQQLATDLKSGDVAAAQKDYATIQRDMQNQAAQGHHRHHHHGGGESDASTISKLMSQLGQALQAGNLTSAQQAYSTLLQDFQQYGLNNGQQTATQSGASSVSVSA